MNDLDTFTIKFVTEGIDKLLDGMDKLTKQMDKVDTSFVNAGTKGDAFFGKLGGWANGLAGLVLGLTSVAKVVGDIFKGGQDIISLHSTADLTGHKAKEVESLGLALYNLSGTGVKSLEQGYQAAGNFFKALNDLRGNEGLLKTSAEVMEQMFRGQSSAILATDSDVQIVQKIRQNDLYIKATLLGYIVHILVILHITLF